MSRASAILPCILLVALSGCSMFGGAPKGTPNFDASILLPPRAAAALNGPPPTMSPPGECSTAYDTPNQTTRDNCIKSLMAMIDVEYDTFRDGLLKMVDDSDLAADVAILGLGSATALVPGKTTKSILGAISAGITGTKAAINSDVLYNTSIIIIVNQMDTDRANQRCVIQKEMTPSATYTMYDASGDLLQYYQAGTFTHALQALEAKTGNQAVVTKQQATDVKATATGATPAPAPAPTPAPSTCSSS